MRRDRVMIQEDAKRVVSGIENVFIKAAPWLIGLAAILLVLLIGTVNKTTDAVKETSAYTRVSNCILGKSGTPFTQEDIELCYVQVEKNTGIQLERFDTQARGDN